MSRPRLLQHNRHQRIRIRFPAGSMCSNDRFELDVAHEVAGHEDEVALEEPVRVEFAHGVAWGGAFGCSQDRCDGEP